MLILVLSGAVDRRYGVRGSLVVVVVVGGGGGGGVGVGVGVGVVVGVGGGSVLSGSRSGSLRASNPMSLCLLSLAFGFLASAV